MKKSLVLALAIGVAAFVAKPAFSQTFTQPVPTAVTVGSLFQVVPSLTSLNYGTITPGQPYTGGNLTNQLNVQTNHNMVWTLSVFGFDFSGPSPLGANAIRAYTAGGTPAGHAFPAFANFNLGGSQLIYTAQAGEFNTGTVGLNIEFNTFIDMANVPMNTQPGAYTGNVDVILADAF